MKNYKICAITTIRGTMEWFVADSMKNLHENGYDVTMMCKMEPDFVANNSDYAKCVDLPIKRGTSLTNLIKCTFLMWKHFRKEKYDAIYYTSPNAAFCAAIAGQFAGVKKRIYNQWGIRYISLEGKKKKIFKLVEKITCDFSTHIREASPMNMQLAIDEGLCKKEKIAVRGIGGTVGVALSECDAFDKTEARKILRKKYSIPEDAFVYGYVGRINADKGINELILAYEAVKESHSNAWLVLVGMVDETNPLLLENKKTADEDDQIIMTGNVPSNQVYRYMAMFDVLTHPTYREGFGKVLQEAMGMYLPIITTNVPGPKEVVEGGVSGILIPDHDEEILRAEMEHLLVDEELRTSLAIAGRKRAEKYFDRPIMLNNILEDTNRIMEE